MNTFGLGSNVSIEDHSLRQNRLVTSTRGYLSGAAPVVHFGLGDTDSIDLQVRWPDGTRSTIDQVDAGQHLVITRST